MDRGRACDMGCRLEWRQWGAAAWQRWAWKLSICVSGLIIAAKELHLFPMRINEPLDSLPDTGGVARVVDAGSFSAAARQLGITPSAVSRLVARLEGALHVRLLERTTRKLKLTDAGAAAYGRCQTMVATAREVWALSDTHSAEPSGLVRMSMPKAVGRQLVHPLVLPFLQRCPEVDVQLLITDRTVDLFEESIDLALRVTRHRGLAGRPLASLHHCICASPQYLAERGHPSTRVTWSGTPASPWARTGATGTGGLSARVKQPPWPCVAAMWLTVRCGWRPR